jgi:hypothetical protein
MRAGYHVAVSAGLSVGLQGLTHSWPASLGCFFSGFLIDLDHYLEYFLIKRKFPFQYKELKDFCMYDRTNKLYLVFHGYEYLIILWLCLYAFSLNIVWLGVALGLTVHLILDQLTNPIKPLCYFLTFRIKNQFDKSKLLSEAYFQRQNVWEGQKPAKVSL